MRAPIFNSVDTVTDLVTNVIPSNKWSCMDFGSTEAKTRVARELNRSDDRLWRKLDDTRCVRYLKVYDNLQTTLRSDALVKLYIS